MFLAMEQLAAGRGQNAGGAKAWALLTVFAGMSGLRQNGKKGEPPRMKPVRLSSVNYGVFRTPEQALAIVRAIMAKEEA